MKMKTSLLVGAFSLALFMAGCTAAPAAVPVEGPAGPQGATARPEIPAGDGRTAHGRLEGHRPKCLKPRRNRNHLTRQEL